MSKETKNENQDEAQPGSGANQVEHSQGGVTTKHDATDLGVPMLPGSPDEPVGPEDALGSGPKRGDYSKRVGDSSYNPTEVVPVPGAKPGEPQVQVKDQRPRASDVGEEAGLKGGVDTA